MNKGRRLCCKISALHSYLPEEVLDNDALAKRYPEWSAEKIFEKTGIRQRHIAGRDEYASDLAVRAAGKVLSDNGIDMDEIDALILSTITPDHVAPCTAALVHHRLGLARHCMAFDINLGCSGFVYGLSLAGSLIHSGQIRKALFITSETLAKWCHFLDKSVSTIFGDGAAAVLLERDDEGPGMGPFLFGTDGRGFGNLIIPASGAHGIGNNEENLKERTDESGNVRAPVNLYMNGPELFRFAITTVPKLVKNLFAEAGVTFDAVDKVVFHQANAFMLKNIQNKLKIPDEKMIYELEDVGNTVSATIPIAIQKASRKGRIRPGDRLLLVGFGLGYAWGGCLLTWNPSAIS